MAKHSGDVLNLRPRITIHRESFPEVHSYLEAIPPDRLSAVISGLVVRAVISLTHGQAPNSMRFRDSDGFADRPQKRTGEVPNRPQEEDTVPRSGAPSAPAALGIFGSVGADAFDYTSDDKSVGS